MLNNKELFERRKRRTRHRLRKAERIKPRLSVFRSSKHIYAQIIDDLEGKTVAAASTIDKDLRESLKTGAFFFTMLGLTFIWAGWPLVILGRSVASVHHVIVEIFF